MKRTAMILAVLTLTAGAAFAQMDAYTTFGGGTLMQYRQTTGFAMWTGLEIPAGFATDTARGFTAVNRTGVFYAHTQPTELQGVSSFLLTKKTLGIANSLDLYTAVGGGVLYQINEGDDDVGAAIKLELGINISGFFGVGFGADFVPITNANDQVFVYGLIDFAPPLLRR